MTNDGLTMVPVTFKCPVTLLDQVRAYATREDRDVSSVCRIALSRLVGGAIKARRKGRPKSKQQKVRCL